MAIPWEELAISACVVSASFTLSFLLSDHMKAFVGPSRYEEENTACAVCHPPVSMLKSICVAVGVHMIVLSNLDKFFALFALGTCVENNPLPEIVPLVVFFVSFEMVDIVILAWTNRLSVDMGLHHALHILLGTIFLSTRRFHVVTLMLLSQETSGVFLNPFLLLRNRSMFERQSTVLFCLFAITFCLYRLGIGAAALSVAFQCIQRRGDSGLVLILAVGYCMQWFWAIAIGEKLARKFRKSL